MYPVDGQERDRDRDREREREREGEREGAATLLDTFLVIMVSAIQSSRLVTRARLFKTNDVVS